MLSACFARGGKVLICSEEGAAADADYLAASFVARRQCADRPGLPALSLNAAAASLRSDTASDAVLARQIETFGRPDDVLIGISAYGVSPPLMHAFKAAHSQGMRSIALLGSQGVDSRRLADIMLAVPSSNRQSVEEVHLVLMHLLCGLVDERLAAGHEQMTPGHTVRTIWELPRRRRVGAAREARK